MNITYLSRKVGGFALAVLFLGGIFAFSISEAQAQRRYYRPYVYRVYRPYDPFAFGWNRSGWNDFNRSDYYNQYVFENPDRAAETGYKNGFSTGKDDGKKRKSYSPERSHYYREAGFGNFGEVYRRSFAQGYRAGYSGGMESS